MTVKTVGHFLMHGRCMRFAMTGLALGDTRMLTPVAESTGKCLMLRHGFFQLFAGFLVTRHTESPGRGHGRVDLQRMMCRMAAETVTGHLPLSMGLMALGTIGNLAVDLMAEGTGFFGMGTFIVGEILARPLMAGKACILNIGSQVEGQWFMRVRVTGQAVLQFKMRPAFMTHGAFRDDILTPWRMLLVAVQTRNLGFMFAAVAGNGCRLILVTFDTVCHLKSNTLRFGDLGQNRQHSTNDECCKKTKQQESFSFHHVTTPFSSGKY